MKWQPIISRVCQLFSFLTQFMKWQPIFSRVCRLFSFPTQVLCAVLEFDVCCNADLKLQIVTTLQSTLLGRKAYGDLTDRLTVLREMVRPSSAYFVV